MKEEIKEILELFAFTDENIMFGDIVELNSKQSHLLLDYITNLQTKNEYLETWNSEIKLQLDNLQQENKEWNMIFDTFSKRPYAHRYLEEKRKELGNDKIIGLDSEMIYKDYYDYKSRCEKVSQVIDEMLIYDDFSDTTKAFGNVKRILKFYLSDCDTLEEFDKLQNGSDSQ